jgi:hypothetical protein
MMIAFYARQQVIFQTVKRVGNPPD